MNIQLTLTCAAVLLLGVSTGQAATYSLGAAFGTSATVLQEPYIGTAVFTYEAESALTPGSYAWDSFTNPTVSITMAQHTFTAADLGITTKFITIELRENGFLFSGDGGGSMGGAADFVQGEAYLNTEPFAPDGARNSALYIYSPDGIETPPNIYGAAATVPEVSSSLLGLAGTTLLLLRRRK